VGETVLRILVYGLLAAASPLALAATLVVLKSRRARLNGFIFAAAFLLGGAAVMAIVITLGSVATPSEGSRDTVAQVLELALGVLLLAASWRMWHGLPPRDPGRSGRTAALLARLSGLTPSVALGMGTVLGIGGPKRLTITIVAATTISAAELTDGQEVGVSVVYVIVAGVLVWIPVAVYLVAGSRSRAWMASAEEWLTANQRPVTTVSLLVFGAILVGDALVQLV
jgi:hypothetical protein